MVQVIVSLPTTDSSVCIPIDKNNNTAQHIKNHVFVATSITPHIQVLRTLDGHILDDDAVLPRNNEFLCLQLTCRVLGGKGGFGSMLRAQGGRMNAQKTTNFEACRDLQGRRIRTVNEAKKLQEELDALPQREAEKRERLKRKIEEALKEKEPRKYLFDDNKFLEDKEEVIEDVKSAIGSVLKKQKVDHKPAASTSGSLFDDEVSSDEDDDEEDEEEEEEEEDTDTQNNKEDEKDTEKDNSTVKGKGKGKIRA